jgi:hypothetical protein
MAQTINETISPHLILGIEEDLDPPAIINKFQELIDTFQNSLFEESPQDWVQSQQICLALEDAYYQIANKELSDNETVSTTVTETIEINEIPRLGQLLTAFGKISLQELADALWHQESLDEKLPLGQILIDRCLISEIELETFLEKQRLIKMPRVHLLGQRLLGLGLITQDMLAIALLEEAHTQIPFEDVLVRRGWLSGQILKALIG